MLPWPLKLRRPHKRYYTLFTIRLMIYHSIINIQICILYHKVLIHLSKGQLSKDHFVQRDISPRRLLSMLITGKSFLGQKSPGTKISLDNYSLDICPLGPRSPWTNVPWTNVATPFFPIVIMVQHSKFG